jgi:DNA-binding NtrC family response regulator
VIGGGGQVNGTRVLLVEDDAPLRRTIVDLLVGWGHEVETASDGLDAWDKLPKFDPMVVISDVSPSRMLAPGLVRAIRRAVPDVSCFILTESPDCREAIEAIRCGARAVIEKPPDAERLRAHLEACLRQGSVM